MMTYQNFYHFTALKFDLNESAIFFSSKIEDKTKCEIVVNIII